MRVYALISRKGGVGKSTLATHLATLAGETGPAVLIDRDPQRTTAKWLDRRAELEPAPTWPELAELEGQTLTAAIGAVRDQEGTLVIDTRPAIDEPEAEAARVADLTIVPVRTGVKDLEAVLDTIGLVRRLKREPIVIINAARNEGRAKDAKAALSEFGVRVCPHYLTDRTAYQDADMDGRTVMEMRGPAAENAAAEMRKVWDWVREVKI